MYFLYQNFFCVNLAIFKPYRLLYIKKIPWKTGFKYAFFYWNKPILAYFGIFLSILDILRPEHGRLKIYCIWWDICIQILAKKVFGKIGRLCPITLLIWRKILHFSKKMPIFGAIFGRFKIGRFQKFCPANKE